MFGGVNGDGAHGFILSRVAMEANAPYHFGINFITMKRLSNLTGFPSRLEDAMTSATEQQNLKIIEEYFAATNRGDVAAMLALTTPDTVFENTSPAPEGERFVGQAAVGAFFQTLFDRNQSTREVVERVIPANDFCTVQWRYDWVDGGGTPGYIRGIALFRFEDGKIAEQLNYVKG